MGSDVNWREGGAETFKCSIGCYKCPKYDKKIIYSYRKYNQVGASWEVIVANEIMNPNLVKQLLYRSGSLNVNSVQGMQRK